jgi:hypothetical protein
MRVESMVAQQAVIAATSPRRARSQGMVSRQAEPAPQQQIADSRLPSAVTDRLADLFANDPGLAAAVSAQMPAARQASARDLAAYQRSDHPGSRPRLVDVAG